MKWHRIGPDFPRTGDIRVRGFFAWLPVSIGSETRWLERVKVKEFFFDAGKHWAWTQIAFMPKDHEECWWPASDKSIVKWDGLGHPRFIPTPRD